MMRAKKTENKMSRRRSLRRNKIVLNAYNNNGKKNMNKNVAKEKNNGSKKHHHNNDGNNNTTMTTTIDTTNNNIDESKIHNLLPGFYDKTKSTEHVAKHRTSAARIESETKPTNNNNNSNNNNNKNIPDVECEEFPEMLPFPTPSRAVVLLQAARAFEVLQHPDDWPTSLESHLDENLFVTHDLSDLSEKNDLEMRFIFDLAYSALKYQSVLSNLLRHCRFYRLFPDLVSHHSTVMVVLYDLVKARFEEPQGKSHETLSLIGQIERAVYSCKTKLSAWLARHRIKANALSLDSLLPEQVRSKDRISSQMNVYIWVNQLKTSIEKVIDIFSEEGFTLTTDNTERGKVFARDRHCSDVLVFPPAFKLYLRQHQLFKDGNIVLQDKSSCIAPLSVAPLIQDDDEVMHVNIGSALATAHVASLLCSTKCRIWGLVDPNHLKSAQKNLEFLDIKNVKLLTESFLDLSPDDQKFKAIRIILLTAKCSKSALNSPVDFVINEGEDISVLKTLSRGGVSREQLEGLCKEEMEYLKHSLLFPNVKGVVYLTRSIHDLENEVAVSKTLEYVNSFVHSSHSIYKVVPPVLPFNRDDIQNKIGLQDKYIKFKPSAAMNGCFLAIIARGGEQNYFAKELPNLHSNSTKYSVRRRSMIKSNFQSSNRNNAANKTKERILADQKLLEILKPIKTNTIPQMVPGIQTLSSEIGRYSLGSPDTFVRPSHFHSRLLNSQQEDIALKQSIQFQFRKKLSIDSSNGSFGFNKTNHLAEHKKIVNHPKPFR
ncbi:putative methyltransferase NSUN7 [Octopus bimaculoides]|uniref:SAM-dependent MTase RsmB/NOP-type domain-containing protein n=1 Tax=Octopus bimaculoides TaxID=37653 RepID=A0A0L8IC25_OCTBM|nr:putative methyltransferase NSUN7 [Octopus bimaculoides]|eukprot:XP_014778375.1 PREDICTED: putative methyltransferase NSUN7 [Octopus bimaculoides]